MVARGNASSRRVRTRAGRGAARAGGRAAALRIAALYPPTANAHYRAELPLRELQRRGHQVLWPDAQLAHALRDGSRPVDAVLVHHFFDEETRDLVRRLRARGVGVVWDKDDDISAIPRFVRAHAAYGGRRGIRRAFAQSVEVARAASAMTTPSAHLAERYRREGVERVAVIENHLAPEDLDGPRPRRAPGIVIGITAALEHAADFKRLKLDATLRALLRDRDGVRVVSIGIDHDLPPERHVNHSLIPVRELIAAEREFDIGLAPLRDADINRARSNVKLKEYAAAGAMWLASPVGPYLGMGEEQGGILVPDRDWRRVLDEILGDTLRRRKLAERARTWARSQTVDRAVGEWEAVLRRAVAAARA